MKTSLFGKRLFKYAATVLWNSLPDDFRQRSNFNQFKGLFFHGMEKLQLCSL